MSSPGGQPPHDSTRGYRPETGASRFEQQPAMYGSGGESQPPPSGPPPQRDNRRGTLVALVCVGAVLVLAGGGFGLHLWLSDSATPTPRPVANPPTASTTSGPSSSAASDSSSPSRSSGIVDVEPTISGWQAVADPKTQVAYDVPEKWKVEGPDTLVGLEGDEGPRVVMHAAATYKGGVCEDDSASSRGQAGIMGEPIEGAVPKKVADFSARNWAAAAADVPKDDSAVPTPKVKPVTVGDDIEAWRATVTVDVDEDDDCDASEMTVVTVAFTHPDVDGAVLFVSYKDNDVKDELDEKTLSKIVPTLRPLD